MLIDTMTKSLDYNSEVLFTVVKSFIVQDPGVNVIELFFFVMDATQKKHLSMTTVLVYSNISD